MQVEGNEVTKGAEIPPANAGQAPEAGKEPEGQASEGQHAKENDQGSGGIDYSNPEQTKSAIEALRKESAKYRTTNKEMASKLEETTSKLGKIENGLKNLFGGGEQDLTPEEQLQQVKSKNESLETRTALLELAYENDIPKSESDYFEFLVGKKLEGLEEGQSLSDEDIAEIATKVKAKAAPASTSVGTKSSSGKAPEGSTAADTTLSVDDFVGMNFGEKSVLYQKDPDTYKALMSAAKKEGKLI